VRQQPTALIRSRSHASDTRTGAPPALVDTRPRGDGVIPVWRSRPAMSVPVVVGGYQGRPTLISTRHRLPRSSRIPSCAFLPRRAPRPGLRRPTDACRRLRRPAWTRSSELLRTSCGPDRVLSDEAPGQGPERAARTGNRSSCPCLGPARRPPPRFPTSCGGRAAPGLELVLQGFCTSPEARVRVQE